MRLTYLFALPLMLSALAAAAYDNTRTLPATGTIQVAFPPNEDANKLIVTAIQEARKTIHVQTFSFTSNEIAFALIAAKRRGVDVRVIADAEQKRKLENHKLGLLQQNNISVWLDEQHQSAHNKIILIDADGAAPIVITGSMNFTYSGQFKNAENLLVLRGNKALAEAYGANWQRHFGHATPYRP
jgi:phosphatidylserine/phosphatidylglycerophosphate/cardiolipin synthase-like enzyme